MLQICNSFDLFFIILDSNTLINEQKTELMFLRSHLAEMENGFIQKVRI